MANIVVLGAGMNGLTVALLLAKDGHRVTVLERDPAPVPPPDAAWDDWERRGVNQFRLLHYLMPRWRLIAEAELPEVIAALEAAGAVRYDQLDHAPPDLVGERRAGDGDTVALTARRPVAEAALAGVVEATEGVDVRRGVAITGLVAEPTELDGIPHVTGVVTEDGEQVAADLVIDATGRRSPLPAWLHAIGAAAVDEREEDKGFRYYGQMFRSTDGSMPSIRGPILQAHDSVSTLTLPSDNGTWGVGFVSTAGDAPLRKLKDQATWLRVAACYSTVEPWLEGEPTGDVAIMAKIPDRIRRFVVDGQPVATGVVALGDAWGCTNPSLGRGISIGALHAVALRDLLRSRALDDPRRLALAWDEATAATVQPWYDLTESFDRSRLAEMEAEIAGTPHEADPGWEITKAFAAAFSKDGDVLRWYLRIASMVASPAEAMAAPGILDKVIEHGAGWRDEPRVGPDRAELLELMGS